MCSSQFWIISKCGITSKHPTSPRASSVNTETSEIRAVQHERVIDVILFELKYKVLLNVVSYINTVGSISEETHTVCAI